jgi:hypothetical protein
VRYDITEGALAGLGVYTIYRQLDQHVHAADPSRFVLDNVRDVRFGAQYTNSGLTLTAEGEHHESTMSPCDSVLLQGQYSQRFSRTSLVTVSLSGQQVDYRSTGERVELYLLNGRWTQKMGEELDFSIHGQGRLENHTISPDIQGVEGGLDLNWHRGQTTIYGSIFASMLNAGPTNTLSEALTFGLRRSF